MTITDKQVEAACIKYHGTTWHEYADYARRIDRERMRALLVEFAEPATGAEGFVRVPLEPTEAMIDAAQSNATGGLMTREARAAAFRAMASAAPSSAEQPAPGAPEADERARFEAWFADAKTFCSLQRTASGDYLKETAGTAWIAWQARARSSAAPSVAPVSAQPSADDALPTPEPVAEVVDHFRDIGGYANKLRWHTDELFRYGTKLYAAPPADAREDAARWRKLAAEMRETAADLRNIAEHIGADELLKFAARLSGMAAVPEGWRLVPVAFTQPMAETFQGLGVHQFVRTSLRIGDFHTRYAAMLDAAPEPTHV